MSGDGDAKGLQAGRLGCGEDDERKVREGGTEGSPSAHSAEVVNCVKEAGIARERRKTAARNRKNRKGSIKLGTGGVAVHEKTRVANSETRKDMEVFTKKAHRSVDRGQRDSWGAGSWRSVVLISLTGANSKTNGIKSLSCVSFPHQRRLKPAAGQDNALSWRGPKRRANHPFIS